jgi:thioredoxin 1
MKTNSRIILTLIFALVILSCAKKEKTGSELQSSAHKEQQSEGANAKITFVELGSVTCIPCKQMQPVMKSIEEKFGDKVKVVFHDVWKDNEARKKYNIDLIPTQVFLDENGNEFFRHQGFFAENEIIKLFETRGVKPLSN